MFKCLEKLQNLAKSIWNYHIDTGLYLNLIYLFRYFNLYLFYSFMFLGLLGTVTQTADVEACPGKCIHALASLLCGQVREDIQCPQGNMRCCVEKPRRNKKKPSQSQKPLNNDVNDSQTTEKTATTNIKKVKKTKRKSTTEQSVEKPLRKQVSTYNLL